MWRRRGSRTSNRRPTSEIPSAFLCTKCCELPLGSVQLYLIPSTAHPFHKVIFNSTLHQIHGDASDAQVDQFLRQLLHSVKACHPGCPCSRELVGATHQCPRQRGRKIRAAGTAAAGPAAGNEGIALEGVGELILACVQTVLGKASSATVLYLRLEFLPDGQPNCLYKGFLW
jgi:hypothetical protein